jgi:hypothetical protein
MRRRPVQELNSHCIESGQVKAVLALVIGIIVGCSGRHDHSSGVGTSRRLARPTVDFHIDTTSLKRLPYEAVRRAAQAASLAWSRSGCAIPRLQIGAPMKDSSGSQDGIDTIVVRESVWAARGDPQSGYYSAGHVALTTSHPAPSSRRGVEDPVREVDIEINAVNYRWGDASVDIGAPILDLQAALTHEFGHALGLKDSCSPTIANSKARSGLMSCALSTPNMTAGAMYPVADLGSTARRVPSEEELLALCSMYGPQATEGGSGNL